MSAISNTIGKIIPIPRRKPKIERKEALAIIPMRNPIIEWEKAGSEIILSIPIRDDRVARVVKAIVKALKIARELPKAKQLALDEVGSFVWVICDGEHSIDGIVQSVSKEYKLTRREAEASVTMFIQTLAKKNLIGLMSAGGKKSVNNKQK